MFKICLKKKYKIHSKLNYVQKSGIFLFFLVFVFLFFYFDKFYLNRFVYIEDYEKIIKNINYNNKKSMDRIIKFIEMNKSNVYGSLASLQLAKMYVNNNVLQDAYLVLKKNLVYASDVNIFNIMILNLSKIQFQLNKKIDSIQTINHIIDDDWKSIKYNFKGDVFFALNNIKQAILEWEKSLYFQNKEQLKEIINIKLNSIKK
ncbi:MAG: tetratricopeptide repeat protein [Buchnera aphidicola (Floraphis choui)]